MTVALLDNNETEIVKQNERGIGCFGSPGLLAQYMQAAEFFARSNIVPKQYQGNAANCLIAIDMGLRMGLNPLSVMQSLYVVYGTPSWSGQFFIACINKSGLFSRLRFEFTDLPDIKARDQTIKNKQCRAFATELATGKTVYGPPVSIQLAVAEGWYLREGSKWRTNPDLMLTYRSASFFGKTYCPEITMGLPTADESRDAFSQDQDPAVSQEPELQSLITEKKETPELENRLLVDLNRARSISALQKIGAKIGMSNLSDQARQTLRDVYQQRKSELQSANKDPVKAAPTQKEQAPVKAAQPDQKQETLLGPDMYSYDIFMDRIKKALTITELENIIPDVRYANKEGYLPDDQAEAIIEQIHWEQK